jgi:dTDP-4-amino-4,6-dideoxygalactose transaminase
VKRQQAIYDGYHRGLADLAAVKLFPVDTERGECPQWTDALADRRDDLAVFFDQRRIGYRKFWFPLHTQAPYQLPDSGFPNSTRLWPRAIWFASAFQLQDSDVDYVCKNVREFYNSAGIALRS